MSWLLFYWSTENKQKRRYIRKNTKYVLHTFHYDGKWCRVDILLFEGNVPVTWLRQFDSNCLQIIVIHSHSVLFFTSIFNCSWWKFERWLYGNGVQIPARGYQPLPFNLRLTLPVWQRENHYILQTAGILPHSRVIHAVINVHNYAHMCMHGYNITCRSYFLWCTWTWFPHTYMYHCSIIAILIELEVEVQPSTLK